MGTDDPIKMGLAETKQKSCAAVKDKESRMNQIPANKTWRADLRVGPSFRRKAPFHKKAASHEAAKARRADAPQSKTQGRARHAVADSSLRREAPFLFRQKLPQSRRGAEKREKGARPSRP